MKIDWERCRIRVNPLVGRARLVPGWRLDQSWVERLKDCDFWMVWAGSGVMRVRGKEVPLRSGVCFWMRPGSLYEAEQDPHDRLGATWIHFDALGADGNPILNNDRLPPEVHEVSDLAMADAIGRRIVQSMSNLSLLSPEARQAAQASADALLRGLLIDLDYRSSNSGRGSTSPLRQRQERMVHALAAQIQEEPTKVPSIYRLAKDAGYSTDHFSRVFQQVTGLSPQAYIVQARIHRACHLLSDTDLPVGRIAKMLDYDNLFFFSRQFKQKTGITPTQYRRSPLSE